MSRPRMVPPSYPIQLRQAMAEYLPSRGLELIGHRRWSDRLLVVVMLLVVFSRGGTWQDRFAQARGVAVGMYSSRRRPGKTLAGFIDRLARHSERLVGLLMVSFRQRMQAKFSAHWRIGRWLVFGVDGTKIDCPRTKANEKHFQIAGRKSSGPQMLLVSLIHVGTGILWSWRRDHAKGSERGLLLAMLEDLPADALLLADAGFVGYDVLRAIVLSGRSILMRAGANLTLLRKLGYRVREKRGIVYLWPERARDRGLEPLVLRQILLRGQRNSIMCLLTNVLESREMSDQEALTLYRRRWCVELLYRGIKQTLERRKMLSDSPGHAEVELDWSVAGAWLLSLMQFAAGESPCTAQQGIAGVLRVVREAMSGRGNRRQTLRVALRSQKRDTYVRRHSKKARDWPHKKNDPPCRVPELRMATNREVQLAKALRIQKLAA